MFFLLYRRKLTVIPPEAEGYSVKGLQAASAGGKAIFFIVPLQETLDTSPLPPDSKHFAKMPKKTCYQCEKVMPLQVLAVHLKTCMGKQEVRSLEFVEFDFLFILSLFNRDNAVHIITNMTRQGHDTACRCEYIKGL